ncbi:MAG: hypothetical protein ACJAWL_001581 [Motiliproteus sp.]|jgi:hypothetical protein
MKTEENIRLIRHGGHHSAPWSLQQRLNDTGSHKRAIWVPIQTTLTKEQAETLLMTQGAPSSQQLNH